MSAVSPCFHLPRKFKHKAGANGLANLRVQFSQPYMPELGNERLPSESILTMPNILPAPVCKGFAQSQVQSRSLTYSSVRRHVSLLWSASQQTLPHPPPPPTIPALPPTISDCY